MEYNLFTGLTFQYWWRLASYSGCILWPSDWLAVDKVIDPWTWSTNSWDVEGSWDVEWSSSLLRRSFNVSRVRRPRSRVLRGLSCIYSSEQCYSHSPNNKDIIILNRQSRWFDREIKEALYVKRDNGCQMWFSYIDFKHEKRMTKNEGLQSRNIKACFS